MFPLVYGIVFQPDLEADGEEKNGEEENGKEEDGEEIRRLLPRIAETCQPRLLPLRPCNLSRLRGRRRSANFQPELEEEEEIRP